MTPCPKCGEPLGARYQHNGELVCWPCTGLEPLPAAKPRPPDPFRSKIADKLRALADDRVWFLYPDTMIGICPVCQARLPEHLTVRFHGLADRADLCCSLGCPEAEIAAAFGLGVTS